MAKWIEITHVRSGPHRSYIGWHREHPNIHVTTREPQAKHSLVQVSQDGDRFTILGQTTAHGIFTQPPGTKGTTLFKKTVVRRTKRDTMAEAQRLKKLLATRYDRLTRAYTRRGSKT